jgi:hypothetical protein
MSWKPLLPEGITPVQRGDIVALHCDDTLHAARSLREMTADWVFFTVGCIYTYGGLDCNIVAEFTQTHADHDCCVMTIRSDRPIFTGMCTPSWPDKARGIEHELCAVPMEYWDGLKSFIGQAGMVDRRRGRYAQSTLQELEIVDFIAVNNAIVASAKPPTVKIAAFGVDGNYHHVAFVPQTEGPHTTARVVRLPIREQTLQVARAILAHDPKPLVESLELKPADPADVAQKIQEAKEKV